MTAVQRHHTYLFAAGILLANWQAHGVVGVFRTDGHLHPTPVADADCWPVTDPRTAELLVATVHLGARYLGWERACAIAEREMTGAEVAL